VIAPICCGTEMFAGANFLDEAMSSIQPNEQALLLNVVLARQNRDQKKMLAAADEFVNPCSNSVLAKVTRIETVARQLTTTQSQARRGFLHGGGRQAPLRRYYRGVMMARIKNFQRCVAVRAEPASDFCAEKTRAGR